MDITTEEQMDMCDFKCETLRGHSITYVVLQVRMYKPEPGHEEVSVKPQMRTVLFIFKGVCIGVIFLRNVNALKNKRKRKNQKTKNKKNLGSPLPTFSMALNL